MNKWIENSLGSLASIRRGIGYSESTLKNNPEDGRPYINMKSFIKDGGYNKKGLKFYSGYFARADVVSCRDLLLVNTDVTLDGDIIGVPAYLPSHLQNEEVLFSHHVTRLSLNEKIEPKFLYYLLCINTYRRWMLKYARGTTVLMLDMGAIKRIPIRYPVTKSNQRKIAVILTSIDTAIEKTEALIEKYQQIKAGLMHDLFTRGVLPNGQLGPPREQAPELYQQTAIGWIPKEWQCSRLGKILSESGGYLQTGPFGSQLHANEYSFEGVPVVMPQDINNGSIEENSIARIPEERAMSLSRHRLQHGDVIIARRGELCRAAAVSRRETDWICGTGCFLLRLGKTKMNHCFFSLAYRYDFIQRQIEGLAVGTTMPSLNNSVMSKLYFPVPQPLEQDVIISKIDTNSRTIDKLEKQVVKLREIKLGLMQDLLTGKVPVKVDDPVADSVNA